MSWPSEVLVESKILTVCACYLWTCQAWLCTNLYTRCWITPNCTKHSVALGRTELRRLVFGTVGLVSISMICNLGNTIAAFKERALIDFYFYNCFDTDRKNDILSVMVILFFITGVKNEKQQEGHQESRFFFYHFSVATSFFLYTVAHWRTESIFLPMQ